MSIKNASVNDLIQANKNIWTVKSETFSVKITDVQDIEQCSIICFSDVAFTNLKGRCSQSS